MKYDRLEDYELFYMEIPHSADYLDGISTGITDEHDEAIAEGLSEGQVSQIARDQLDALPETETPVEGQEGLFTEDTDTPTE